MLQPLVLDNSSESSGVLEVAGVERGCHACATWEYTAFNIDFDDGSIVFTQTKGDGAVFCETYGASCSDVDNKADVERMVAKTHFAWPASERGWKSLNYSFVDAWAGSVGTVVRHRILNDKSGAKLATAEHMSKQSGDWRGAVRPRVVGPAGSGNQSFFDQLRDFAIDTSNASTGDTSWPTQNWLPAEKKGENFVWSNTGLTLRKRRCEESFRPLLPISLKLIQSSMKARSFLSKENSKRGRKSA